MHGNDKRMEDTGERGEQHLSKIGKNILGNRFCVIGSDFTRMNKKKNVHKKHTLILCKIYKCNTSYEKNIPFV